MTTNSAPQWVRRALRLPFCADASAGRVGIAASALHRYPPAPPHLEGVGGKGGGLQDTRHGRDDRRAPQARPRPNRCRATRSLARSRSARTNVTRRVHRFATGGRERLATSGKREPSSSRPRGGRQAARLASRRAVLPALSLSRLVTFLMRSPDDIATLARRRVSAAVPSGHSLSPARAPIGPGTRRHIWCVSSSFVSPQQRKAGLHSAGSSLPRATLTPTGAAPSTRMPSPEASWGWKPFPSAWLPLSLAAFPKITMP